MRLDREVPVAQRLRNVRQRIAQAARRRGRDPARIVLVGASKGQPADLLREAWEAGLEDFGENRVQEALEKMATLPSSVRWHLLGPLQTNKAKRAVESFTSVHSVDRMRIAEELDRQAGRLGRSLPCFLEVNIGAEPTKHGFHEEELLEHLPGLAGLRHLKPEGLMAIPPQVPDPEQARPWFRRLARLRDRVTATRGWERFPGFLSMGMSADYEVAVEEGATHVRIGTALFGPRPDR